MIAEADAGMNATAQIIIAIGTALAAILSAMVGLVALKLGRTTEKKVEDNAKQSEAIHVLVNSSMGAALRIAMIQAKRIAEMTGNPEDAALAAESRKVYEAHQAKQAMVDAKSAELSPEINPKAAPGMPTKKDPRPEAPIAPVIVPDVLKRHQAEQDAADEDPKATA